LDNTVGVQLVWRWFIDLCVKPHNLVLINSKGAQYFYRHGRIQEVYV